MKTVVGFGQEKKLVMATCGVEGMRKSLVLMVEDLSRW
jgi:hypothetical protein